MGTISLIAVFLCIVSLFVLFIPVRKREITAPNISYHDKYVEIYNDHIILNGFHFGPFGKKKIRFEDVGQIRVIKLDLLGGKYRFQGTGDLKTWFSQDLKRSSKEKAFILERHERYWDIGFTVEDFEKALAALKQAEPLQDKILLPSN